MSGLESSRDPRCLPCPELAVQKIAKMVPSWEPDLTLTAEEVFGHMSSDEDDDHVGVYASVAVMKKPAGIEPLNLSESSSSSDSSDSSSESGSTDLDGDSEDSIMAEAAAQSPLIAGLEKASEASAQRKMMFLRSIESNGVFADNRRRVEKKPSTKGTRRPTRKSRNSSGMPQLLCQNVLGVRRSARSLVGRDARRNKDSGEDSHSEEEHFPSGLHANRSSFFHDPGLRKNVKKNESKQELARDMDANEDRHADKLSKLLRTNQLRMMKMSGSGRSIAQFGIHPSTDPFLFAAVCTQNVLSFWKITQDDYHPGLFAKSDVLVADAVPEGFPGADAACDVTWMGFHPAKPDFLLMTTSHGQVVPYSLEKTNYNRRFHREWRSGTQNYKCADFSGPDTLLVGTTHGVVREIDTRLDHMRSKPYEKGEPHEVHYSHDIAAVSVHPEKPHLWAVAAEGEDLCTGRSERPGYLLDSRFPRKPVALLGKDIVDFAFSPSGKFLAARKLPNTFTGAASSVVFYAVDDLMQNQCTWSGAMEDLGGPNPPWNVDVGDVGQLGAISCSRRPGRVDIQAVHPGCWVPETNGLYLVGQPRSEMIKIFKPTGMEVGGLDYATSLLRHGNGRVFGSSRTAASMVRHHPKTSMVACAVRDHLIYFADKDLY